MPLYRKWWIKCFLDSCKGALPFQRTLRNLKRGIRPYRSDLEENDWTIVSGLKQISWANSVRGKRVLEVGSGWEPLVPLVYYLAGAEVIYLTDLRRLMDRFTLAAAIQSLVRQQTKIQESLDLTRAEFDAALEYDATAPLESTLKRFRFEYLAPCDCRRLPLPENSVDIVESRSVLEHIPRQVIIDIFREVRRVLRAAGVMIHMIDNSDHWQHYDPSISRVNFLHFTDAQFRLTYLNPIKYQNRIRHSEYLRICEDCGFRLLREEGMVDAKSVDAVKTLRVAPQFNGFTPEDLATVTSHLMAAKVTSLSAQATLERDYGG